MPDPYKPYDEEKEQYDPEFIALMQQLNERVAEHNEPIEGNYFYPHGKVGLTNISFHKAVGWRQNLLHACQGKQKILEIGLNAGHSSLAMLYHNKEATIHSVDICQHSYTPTAADFLTQHFPKRFEFHCGDSLHVLPRLSIMRPELKFDMIHIDGGHGVKIFASDFFNSLHLIKNGGYLVIDDVVMNAIGNKVNKFIADGLIEAVHKNWQQPSRNILVKVLNTKKPTTIPKAKNLTQFDPKLYKNALQPTKAPI